MKKNIFTYFTNKKFLITLFIFLAIGASIQSLTLGMKTYHEGGKEYSRYNNYQIFAKSYDHLKNHQDLYILYPEEHWDLYKYTPTFSVFFGVFSHLPDWLGLSLWNLLNALIVVFAVYYLPHFTDTKKGWILLILSIELLTSMQNAQSNGLMTGLMVFSFGFLETKKYSLASLFLVFSIFIKLFGIVGFSLFLFYPKKWKLAGYSLLWSAIFLILPLLFVDFHQYVTLLKSYLNLLTNDHASSYGYSVMGWLHTWFDAAIDKNTVVLAGAIVFLLPFANYRAYKNLNFRYFALTSVLIWVVIFNHKAESPTFIIAMAGVSLWFIKGDQSILNILLFIMAMVLTSLSPTDLFPRSLRDEFVTPYTLKAFPCILIWLKIIYDMIATKTPKMTAVT